MGQIYTWGMAKVAQVSSGSPFIPALSTGLQEETETPFHQLCSFQP